MRGSGLSNHYGELLYKAFPSIKSVCVYYSGKYKQRQYLRVTLRQPDQDARNTFESIKNHLMVCGPQVFSYIHLTSSDNLKGTFRLNGDRLRPSRYVALPLPPRKKRLAGNKVLTTWKSLQIRQPVVFTGFMPNKALVLPYV